MKIKNITYVAAISMLIIASGVLGFLEIRKRPVIQNSGRQHHLTAEDQNPLGSVTKSTILLLLAIGAFCILGVRRKKKNKKKPAHHNKRQTMSEDRDKAFVKLNKEYLNLQYKVTQHKFSGESPPDGLNEAISNIERKVRLISRALE